MEIVERLEKAYYGKRVFITGHTGFKGSWLIVLLKYLGANIKGYALPPVNNDLYLNIQESINIESVYDDIRNYESLKKEILEYQPDYLIHLAAQPLVLDGYRDPRYTMDVNVMGTCNVLEALRQMSNTCKTIIVTTDKVYEEDHTIEAYKESDRLSGVDPYSGSKSACELVTKSYIKSYFNESAKSYVGVVRAGNVIGGGDFSENRIVPDIIRSLSMNQAVQVRNPHAVRPWQHVVDPLIGYLLFAARLGHIVDKDFFALNFGPDKAETMNVLDLVKNCLNLWGDGAYETVINESAPKESRFLKLDSIQAKHLLKWQPYFNSAEAISTTMDWYKRVIVDGESPYHVTLSQIQEILTNDSSL
ncbi:MAG: CDP-glucose 4,6-dehydratase [Cyclobacteriaceae bacterium]